MKNNIYSFLLRGDGPFTPFPRSLRLNTRTFVRTHISIANEQKKRERSEEETTKNEADCIAIAMPSNMIVWVMCHSHFNRCLVAAAAATVHFGKSFAPICVLTHFMSLSILVALSSLFRYLSLFCFSFFLLSVCVPSFICSFVWRHLYRCASFLPLCNSILIWMSVVPIIIIIALETV